MWVTVFVDIILSGLQYRFSCCGGGDVDINHDNGKLYMTEVLKRILI